ncbi:MAG TPA: protein kinase [Blastocatellia bacterium]|nr:protein kinase [Blastocatellia bacterium]
MDSKLNSAEFNPDQTLDLEASEPIARTVGRYKLLEKIGEGGMGEIYLAEDPTLNRRVALKLLPDRFTQDEDRVRRFEQEAKAASALNQPNIITIFEIGKADGAHYMVTEYIQGETLRQKMASNLTINSWLDVGIQVASGLKAAHEAGIIHRDIKPENVMVRPDGLVKLLDFGIAKLIDRPLFGETENSYGTKPDVDAVEQAVNETSPGVIIGTVTYMPPEQLRGLKLDAGVDLFSLGVVLYEVITGESPFPGTSQVDVISAILDREPQPLANLRPEAPPELQRIISKALEKDRDHRYQSANDLLVDLTSLKHELEFQSRLDLSIRNTGEIAGGAGRSTTDLESVGTKAKSFGTMISSEIKRHKLLTSLLVLMVIAIPLALVYLGYLLFSRNSDSALTSVAVLPFKNLSSDPEQEYLSNGICETLINRLSRLPSLKVIASSSTLRYKDTGISPSDVARELHTTAVVTGRIQQVGDHLSISVELVDGRDSRQLWGERYNREAKDLLSLEAEISSDIAEKLRLQLTPGQQQQVAKRSSAKPKAYELLMKGAYYRSKGGTEDRKKAAEYFNQAIAVDPEYALAYAEVSDIQRSLVGSSVLDPKQYLSKAEQDARKAIQLDDTLAEAHYALANVATYEWKWEEAEREYKRAIELNPNLALAHRWYASYLRIIGRHDEAVAEIHRARDLDPISPGVNATVGYILFSARKYDQAIDVLKNTIGLDGEYPYTHLFLGFTYAAKGMYSDAIPAYRTAMELGLNTPSTRVSFAATCARSGDRQQAEAILKQFQMSKEYVSPGDLAILYASLGDRDQALALLEKAYEARDPQLQNLGVSPAYDPLRSDARFQDLLRKLGLSG